VHPIRILLADDNDEVLAAVREELGAEFEIIGTVTNGQDAVEAVRLFDPDVVVMDIAMPVLDGIEALERWSKLLVSLQFGDVVRLSVSSLINLLRQYRSSRMGVE